MTTNATEFELDVNSIVTEINWIKANMGGVGDVSTLLESIFPVGSIYMTTEATNPSTIFGFGTWVQIEGRMILGASSTHAVGSTGGAETHTLTVAQTPAHTHSRGTMEIAGSFSLTTTGRKSVSGAFYAGSGTTNFNDDWLDVAVGNVIGFKASNNWTGATSSVGSGQAHNNMPPFYTAYIWRRTA